MHIARKQQDDLQKLVEILFGRHVAGALSHKKHLYNSRTVEVMEKALTDIAECNTNLFGLLTSLVGSGTLLTKGWLRKSLEKIVDSLLNNNFKIHGAGCMSTTARNYRTEIEMSLYW